MKLLLLISAVVLAAAVVVAVPVQTDDDVDHFVDTVVEKPQVYKEKPTVEPFSPAITSNPYVSSYLPDVTDLINDMRRLHESAGDVINQVEATLSTLESLMPHSIRKRQTTLTGKVDHGPRGTSYGASVTHQRGNTKMGANVNRGPGGTSYGANVDRTWNNGRTSFGANIGRGGGGGTFGGISFSHKFK